MLARLWAPVAILVLSCIATHEATEANIHAEHFSNQRLPAWEMYENGGGTFTNLLDLASAAEVPKEQENSRGPAPDTGTCTMAAKSPLMGAPVPQAIFVSMDGRPIGHLGLYYENHGDHKHFDCTRGPHTFRIEIDYHGSRPYTTVCTVTTYVIPGTVYYPIVTPAIDNKNKKKPKLSATQVTCTMMPDQSDE